MTEKRPTNPPLAPIDLFPRVEAYYREGFVESRRGEDFDRWLAGARDHLRETATYDADPAFLLHVLVCTAGRGLRRYADQSPALKSLPKRHRAQLVGALKFLRERGEACEVRRAASPAQDGSRQRPSGAGGKRNVPPSRHV